MKKLVFLFSAGILMTSCSKEVIRGNGPVVTENRSLSNFTEVSVSGSTDVHITYGSSFKVEVKGHSNLLPHFESRLVNNTLYLGYEPGVNVHNDNTEVFITMPLIRSLATEGSGNINTTGQFDNTTEFKARVSGSGNIHFSQGNAQSFSAKIEGSGNIHAFGLQTADADINTTGSGNTEIKASNTLKVKITGSGSVYYRGTPTVTTDITGSGVVRPA